MKMQRLAAAAAGLVLAVAGFSAHADDVMGDIPHFTNIQPIVQFNEPVAL